MCVVKLIVWFQGPASTNCRMCFTDESILYIVHYM